MMAMGIIQFLMYFNSRAHVERDAEGAPIAVRQCISTHALTWSATSINGISIIWIEDFNSRAHVERDGLPTFLQTSR